MREIKLLPCPFCGKDAQIAPDEIGSGGQHVPPYHAGCFRGAGCGVAFTSDEPDEAAAEWNRRPALSSAAVAEREPVAWLYDWTDDDGTTQTDASTQSVKSVNFQPVRNVRPLHLDPPPTSELEAEIARLKGERDSLLNGHRILNVSCSRLQDRAEAAEARLAEAMKALEPFAEQADNPQWWNDSSIRREHLHTARRALAVCAKEKR